MNIFEAVRELNFPDGKYIVVGSGILAAKGIRETNDLDIIVTPDLFEKLKSEEWTVYPWTKESISGRDWLKKNNVEAYIQLSRKTGGISAEELLKNAEVINGIPFITLEQLVDFKREYGRPKDFDDIKLIEEYLRTGKASIAVKFFATITIWNLKSWCAVPKRYQCGELLKLKLGPSP